MRQISHLRREASEGFASQDSLSGARPDEAPDPPRACFHETEPVSTVSSSHARLKHGHLQGQTSASLPSVHAVTWRRARRSQRGRAMRTGWLPLQAKGGGATRSRRPYRQASSISLWRFPHPATPGSAHARANRARSFSSRRTPPNSRDLLEGEEPRPLEEPDALGPNDRASFFRHRVAQDNALR